MMHDVLLTFIVPVYNTCEHVERCLRSVVNQGLESHDYEVIVVDDGSTDGSRDAIEALMRDHPQLTLLVERHAGVSAARNAALDRARGRYVQFVDSDDYLKQGMMAPLLRRAIDERLDVLEFNYWRENMAGEPLAITRDDNYSSTAVSTGVDYLSNHCMTPYIWRFLISRDFLEQHHWRFDTSLIVCEDGALIARFMLKAQRVAHDAATVYCYVERGDSAMHSADIGHLSRRLFSQVDAAAAINDTIKQEEQTQHITMPASVYGVRNVYLYFSMTKALTCGLVDDVLARIRQAGLFPFPCVGPEANYWGMKWKIIHVLMMRPRLWRWLSVVYRKLRK